MFNSNFNPHGSTVIMDFAILFKQYIKIKERTNKINKLLDKNIKSKNE